MNRWLASLCLAAVCSISPAIAQETAAPTDPNDPKIVLAAKILEETHALDTMRSVLDTMVPTLVASLKRQAPTLTDDQLKSISESLTSEMKARLPKMLIANARIYAMHFSLAELNDIETFYRSPAGQKVIAENPKIMQETIPLGMAWGRESATEAMDQIIAKLRKDGVKL
jgi:hypothetical protein